MTPMDQINFIASPFPKAAKDHFVMGKNLYRQSILRKGYVNATIIKPRTYFIIENSSPGTPVFNQTGNWLGVSVYKMERGQPSSLVTLPASDILEIADQVRSRVK